MAAVTTPSSNSDLLGNVSLHSQVKTDEISEATKRGISGSNAPVMYHQGYGHLPYGAYPSPTSPVPTLGHDGYGAQHYQYPGAFYQPPSSTSMFYPPNQASQEVPSATADKLSLSNNISGSVNRNNGSKPFRPSNQNSSINSSGSYKRGSSLAGFPSSGYYDPRFGYDGFQSPIQWFDASAYSHGSSKYATGTGFSSHLNYHPTSPTTDFSQASGLMNSMYPSNRMYGPYGYRAGTGFGSFPHNSWTNGHGWVVVDNKYKPRGRGYGNENVDGLSELNRGPRAKGFKNQREFGPVTQAAEEQNLPLTENNKEDNLPQIPDKEHYNSEDFPVDYSDAKFFVIKSYSEDDVHKSIKYGVWASTPNGNKKLDAAYHLAKENPGGCPVFLLFSVNTSGQFVGLAEMVGPVDFNRTVEYWQQDKWVGCFPVKWHIIKDVPNSSLRHITLENNENKPVTNSRDTQEVMFEKGIQVLKLVKAYEGKTSILDDFGFYAARERIMQEKRAKQNSQKQIFDGKLGGVSVIDDKNKAAAMKKDGLIKEAAGSAGGDLAKKFEELQLQETDGSGAAVEKTDAKPVASSKTDAKPVASSESKVAPNVVASAC